MNATVRSHLLRQAGAISREQVLAAAMSDRQISRLLRSSDWLRVHPGVYRSAASVPLPETGLWAALLWLGGDALLAEESAAWWWGIVDEPPATWTFAGRTRCRGSSTVRVSDSFVALRDRWRHRGIAVTSPAWSVLRAAAAREDRRAGAGVALVDHAKQTRAVRQEGLERAFSRHPACWGGSTIRTLLRRTGDGAQSELEREAVTILKGAGVTGFRPNLSVRLSTGRSVEIDIAFPSRRIAIELDGFAFHAGAAAFRRDVSKGNALMADGWTVRRFTWDDVLEGTFLDAVLELLARCAP